VTILYRHNKATRKEVKTIMKTLATIVAVIFIGLSTQALSEENTTIDTKVKNFLTSEWNSIVEFQKTSWADSKDQLARNKLQIQSLWNKIVSSTKTENN
jgi:hypothetical protein|tara:strand:- start:44 stop:340 length:297 start_codon:yes stop_codon:yes gene_type:complete